FVLDALDLEHIPAAVPVDGQVIDAGVCDGSRRGVADGLQPLAQRGNDAFLTRDMLVHDRPGEGGRVVRVSGTQRVGRWGERPDADGTFMIEDGQTVDAFVTRAGDDVDGVAIAAVGDIQADIVVGRAELDGHLAVKQV